MASDCVTIASANCPSARPEHAGFPIWPRCPSANRPSTTRSGIRRGSVRSPAWRTAGDVGLVRPSERVARTTPASVAALGVTGRTAGTSALVHSAGVPTWSDEADIGVRLTTTADLPSAERSASVLARAVIEVLSGRRPLGQLRAHCAPDVYAGLANRPTFASASLPHLVSVRVCEPADANVGRLASPA